MITIEIRDRNSAHAQKHGRRHHLHVIARLDTVPSASCDILQPSLL